MAIRLQEMETDDHLKEMDLVRSMQPGPASVPEKEFADALTDTELPSGEWISEIMSFLIPPFAPASTPKKQRGKTRSEWSLAMKLSIRGAPPYPDNFTIHVAEGDRRAVPVGVARPVDDAPAT